MRLRRFRDFALRYIRSGHYGRLRLREGRVQLLEDLRSITPDNAVAVTETAKRYLTGRAGEPLLFFVLGLVSLVVFPLRVALLLGFAASFHEISGIVVWRLLVGSAAAENTRLVRSRNTLTALVFHGSAVCAILLADGEIRYLVAIFWVFLGTFQVSTANGHYLKPEYFLILLYLACQIFGIAALLLWFMPDDAGGQSRAVVTVSLIGIVMQVISGHWGSSKDLYVAETLSGIIAKSIDLQREREIVAVSLAAMHEGVVIFGARGPLRYNQAATKLWDGSFDDLPSLFASSEAIEMVEVGDATSRVLEIVRSPVHDQSSETSCVYVMRDLTTARKLETEKVQNQKLLALGTLAGGVAHEFNNVLMVVGGATELLSRTENLSEQGERYLDAIAQSSGRAAAVTSQLLSYARRSDSVSSYVSPRAAVKSIVTEAQQIVASRIEVDFRTLGDAARIMIDPAILQSSLLNLITNADDAMGGSGVIEVKASSEQGLVEFSVSDSGAGIMPDDLHRVVEPFFTTKEPGEGTGLGLSMVAAFAEQSGGTLQFSSELGEGTTVVLALPDTQYRDRIV